jgi:hypothetical protein
MERRLPIAGIKTRGKLYDAAILPCTHCGRAIRRLDSAIVVDGQHFCHPCAWLVAPNPLKESDGERNTRGGTTDNVLAYV